METLDPNKFIEKKQQRLHIGDLHTFTPYIVLHNQSRLVMTPRIHYEYTKKTDSDTRLQVHDMASDDMASDMASDDMASESSKRIPFPPDTKAFLYYFTSPKKPRISGELRLRVASSDDFASFESGSDLLKLNGQPWSRPLWIVSKGLIPLYEKLREDQLVKDDLDAVLSTFPRRYLTASGKSHNQLYTLNDAFIVDFSSYSTYFFVITEQGMESLRLIGPFFEIREKSRVIPYTGAYTNHYLSILLD